MQDFLSWPRILKGKNGVRTDTFLAIGRKGVTVVYALFISKINC